MPSPDKPRYPREAALQVARELCRALKPVTERLIVAGSLRRRATTVGDVEILYIPRTEPRQIDLLTHGPASLADDVLYQLLADGTITRRLNKNGSATWGAANKLAVHTHSGIPVDLFETTEDAWWNYLVCRTGPALMMRMIRMRQALEHANSLCRSAFQIAARDGKETNWIAFRACLKKSLEIQHAVMFPAAAFSSQNASGVAAAAPAPVDS